MSKRIRQLRNWTSDRIATFRDAEDGSFIILSLFLFLAIIVVGGIGVDILRHDYARVRMQNTADAAALAAADLDQSLDSKTVVESHFDAAELTAALQNVSVSPPSPNSRTVGVTAATDVSTWFMPILGVNKLRARTSGTATEEIQDVEISLVLDVSGSMEGIRLARLKEAAKRFVDVMLLDRDGNQIVGEISINLVPYSAQVQLDDDFLSKLTLAQAHPYSNCLEFRGADFETTAIDKSAPIRQHIHVDPFSYAQDKWDQKPDPANLDCSTHAGRKVTYLEDDVNVLKSRIDAFSAQGNTSTEFGLKVGAMLLDRSTHSILSSHPNVKSRFHDRPYAMDRINTLKVVVVMSDGQNTEHKTFADGYEGDVVSDTWAVLHEGHYYFTIADTEQGNVDGDDDYYEPGYYPTYDSWGKYVLGGSSAKRLTWQQVFARVTLDWHSWYGRAEQAGSGTDTRNKQDVFDDWQTRVVQTVGKATKDADTRAICNAIKDQGILIYSIAFEISEAEAELLKSCATNENLHYNVSGTELNYAFSSIATSLNSLQLVQ